MTSDGEDVYPPLPGGEVVDMAEARARLLNRQQRQAAVAQKLHPSSPAFASGTEQEQGGVLVGADGRPFMTEYEPGRFLVWCAEGGCEIVGTPGGAMCLTCAVADDADDDDDDREGDGCEL